MQMKTTLKMILHNREAGCSDDTTRHSRWKEDRLPAAVTFQARRYVLAVRRQNQRDSSPGMADLIGSVELRSCVTTIKDQDGVGTCATESTTQAVEIVRRFEGQEYVELNPWSIYWYTSGGRDSGSSIDDNLAYVREKGICPESLWPRSKGWKSRPSAEAMEAALQYRIDEFYDVTTIAEAGTALLLGFPVVFGWQGHSLRAHAATSTPPPPSTPIRGRRPGATTDSARCRLNSINFGYGMFALADRHVFEGGMTWTIQWDRFRFGTDWPSCEPFASARPTARSPKAWTGTRSRRPSWPD